MSRRFHILYETSNREKLHLFLLNLASEQRFVYVFVFFFQKVAVKHSVMCSVNCFLKKIG